VFLDKATNELPDFASGAGIQRFAQLNELLALGTADPNQQLAIFLVGLHLFWFHLFGTIQSLRILLVRIKLMVERYLHCVYVFRESKVATALFIQRARELLLGKSINTGYIQVKSRGKLKLLRSLHVR